MAFRVKGKIKYAVAEGVNNRTASIELRDQSREMYRYF